jgi:hypothetical protein
VLLRLDGPPPPGRQPLSLIDRAVIDRAAAIEHGVQGLEQVDCLFYRMFGFLYYSLQMTGRASAKVHT